MKIDLNEKLWFGKHKGKRLKSVIDENSAYIKKLLNEYDVQLSDDAIKYLKGYKYRKPTNDNLDPF